MLEYFRGRPDKLLVLNICGGEGWEKLAPFLGFPIPDEPVLFENKLKAGPRDESEEGRYDAAASPSELPDLRGEELINAYIDAFQRQKLDECLEFYADDATVVFRERLRGRQALRKWHHDRFKTRVTFTKINVIDVAGDTVTVSGAVTTKYLRRVRINRHGKAFFQLSPESGKIVSMRMVHGR